MTTLSYIFLISSITLVGVWVAHAWVKRRLYKLPPGPFPAPILGNLLNLIIAGTTRHRYFAILAKKFGPIFFLQLGSIPVVIVSSPTIAHKLLHTHDKTFASRPPFTNAKVLMGEEHGAKAVTFLPYSDEWKEARKLYINQLFSPRRIGEFQSEIILPEIRRLIETQLVPASEFGDPVNLTTCIGNLVEDIICRMILRRRIESVFVKPTMTTTMVPTTHLTLTQLVHEFTKLLGAPLVGEFIPFLSFIDNKTKASMMKWKSSFDDFMDHIIDTHEKDLLSRNELAGNILDMFLLRENKLSKGVIKASIMELFAAGSDTTSAAIDWGMCEVLSNPRIARKLRDELNAVVGQEGHVTESHIPRLPYLRAIVKETLRMHPTAPLLMPHMSLDVCHDVGGYSIPKGTRLFVNAWAIGRDPTAWKDDPDKFLPERFLSDAYSSMDVKGHHFELLPFGSGRRMCPSVNLAVPLVEVTMANLVHAFDKWELVLPPGKRTLDMSDECGIILRRVDPLIAIPRKKVII